MDYKQIDKSYADSGNFNFGAVGKALGFPDSVLKNGAGAAQGIADGLSFSEAFARSLLDPANRGDNPEDQYQIWKGIKAAEDAGVGKSDLGIFDYFFEKISFAFDLLTRQSNSLTCGILDSRM
ncbi:MAG TPA: polymorphic toxin type 44 domain-containing protein, partial [Accumulibacter sp.]|nr:polymorphic toxin type 44 domain-containing protein [Accumulibacter sp.]